MQQVPVKANELSAHRSPALRAAERSLRFVNSDAKAGYRWAALCLAAFFTILATAFVILGAPPVAGGPWDTLSFLNAGWRIIHGQIPHVDFHDPLGDLTYLLVAFGMKAGTTTTASITYGSVLFFALLMPVVWYLAASRFSWPICSLFTLFQGFYLITPRPPGYPIRYTSYAMMYNRHGYVLLALLSLCVLLRRRKPTANSEWMDGAIVGALWGLTLYCKITYFVAGTAILAFGFLLSRTSLRWLLACSGTFAGVCAAFRLFLHIGLYAYFRDVVAAGHAQSPGMRISLFDQGLRSNAGWICLLAFCLVLWSWVRYRNLPRSSPPLRLWLVAGAIVAVSLWILSGNASQGGGAEDPMYFLAAVVLFELLWRQDKAAVPQPNSRVSWAALPFLILLIPLFSLPILAREVASCGYVIAWDMVERPHFDPSRKIDSPNMSDFYVPAIKRNTGYWPIAEFPEKFNEGIHLLRANSQTGDRITSMSYVDPFPMALGVPPANDGPLWWDDNISFDATHFPPAEEFLGHASLVIIPRLGDRSHGCCFETVDLMVSLYGDYLHEHFREVASTTGWTLYRRSAE